MGLVRAVKPCASLLAGGLVLWFIGSLSERIEMGRAEGEAAAAAKEEAKMAEDARKRSFMRDCIKKETEARCLEQT